MYRGMLNASKVLKLRRANWLLPSKYEGAWHDSSHTSGFSRSQPQRKGRQRAGWWRRERRAELRRDYSRPVAAGRGGEEGEDPIKIGHFVLMSRWLFGSEKIK